MTDWIEHNGGPQPVADDVWVDRLDGGFGLAGFLEWNWSKSTSYRILNQHLIDAKQAEIDALRDDLETWQSVFPHIVPDRLKGQEVLGREFTEVWDANTDTLHADPETIAKEADNEPR